MNREDIIRMAREAGAELAELPRGDAWLFTDDECLERFAALVASAERKECEKIIWDSDAWIGSDAKIWLVKSIQEARGQA